MPVGHRQGEVEILLRGPDAVPGGSPEVLMSSEARNSSRWIDEPLLPNGYEDLAYLLKLARKVRNRRIEFTWTLSPDDLRSLRRGLFESAGSYAGRYRAYDGLLLAAINQALDERHSSLSIPVSASASSAGTVACEPVDGDFRVVGTTTFDIFFGHASGAFTEDPWTTYLSAGVKSALAKSIAPLGWDVELLNSQKYRPARNGLYGMPLAYNVEPVATAPSGPPLQIDLAFQGPFSAFSGTGQRCLFEDPLGQLSGIYLWTVGVGDAQFVWYVGQTRRSFAQRTAEHIASYLSGQYPPVDAAALREGRHTRPPDFDVAGVWPANLPRVLDHLPALATSTLALLKTVQFHLAPATFKASELDRVEGAICRFCRAHATTGVRSTLLPGIRVPARIPGDRSLRLKVTTEASLEGFPAEISE